MPNFIKTKVDDNSLRNGAAEIDSDINAIIQSFQRISDALTNTLSPTWEDMSKAMFFNQFSRDSSFFTNHIQAMKNMTEQLSAAAGIYMGAEEQARQIVNNIKTE